MYSNIAQVISILLMVAYYYKKTKDKMAPWFFGIIFLCAWGIVFFDWISRRMPKIVPLIMVMGFVLGLPLLMVVAGIVTGILDEKGFLDGKRQLELLGNKNKSSL